MSTHANVILEYGETLVLLYTHRFGFPAETGALIAEALRPRSGPDDVLRALLQRPGPDRPSYKPEFLLTFSVHRNVRYVYRVSFETRGDTPFTICVSENREVDTATTQFPSLTAFIQAVNADRQALNQQLTDRPAESASEGLEPSLPFEMLALE